MTLPNEADGVARFSITMPKRIQRIVDSLTDNRSEFISQTLLKALQAEGLMPENEDHSEFYDLLSGTLERVSGDDAKKAKLKEVLEQFFREQEVAP